LKIAVNATERMQRRTRDKMMVERTEKTKTDLNDVILSAQLRDERKKSDWKLTTAAALSLPSSATKLPVGLSAAKLLVGVASIIVVTRGVLIMDCGRSEIRESKAVPDRMGKKRSGGSPAAWIVERKEEKEPVPSSEEGLKRERCRRKREGKD
jgi:hypothetical protein